MRVILSGCQVDGAGALRRKEGRERTFHVDDSTSNAEVPNALPVFVFVFALFLAKHPFGTQRLWSVGFYVDSTAGYLSLGPILKNMIFCDLSVRSKAWLAARVEQRRREH